MFFGTKDNKFKKNVLKVSKTKIDNNELKDKSKYFFDARKTISYELLTRISQEQFVCGNNPWGYNSYRISMHFYKKFFKENNSKNFEKIVLNLLKQSKNKTPKFSKEIKLPFKQLTRNSHEPTLLGKEIIYSDKNLFKRYIGTTRDSGPYNYNYCNKSKVNFFKGPSNEEKEIIKNGYENLFSQSFVYGYITSFSNLIFRWGELDEPDFDENNPGYNFPEDTTEIFTKINSIKVKLFNKLFKLSEKETTKIINDIEESVYGSTLTNFLLAKEENYYAYTMYDDQVCETTGEKAYEGTLDFIDDLKNKRENKYNKGYKYERINKIFHETRNDKYEVSQFKNYGGILNFELFRFFTLRCFGLEPYDIKKLNINERDIFIRYAINMGAQEINYFVVSKIFGRF